MATEKPEEQGAKLLSAVERIVDDSDKIIALVQDYRRRTPQPTPQYQDLWHKAVAEAIVSSYSNRSAVSGGVTALPALVPGIGTLIAGLGGWLADMVMVLKFEVEMALALTHLYGFDIRDPNERQLAFLLASVQTYEAKAGESIVKDLGQTAGTAIWNYTPRQVSKDLVTVMTRLALLSLSKSFARALPVVGIVVGSSLNKVLTTKVGNSCIAQLALRRKQAAS
jgi:uncharacterized protein (DUF697 family)